MIAKDFIQSAQGIQSENGDKSLLAIPQYQEAIAAWKENDDEYELLYAHYQIMWISSHNHNAEQCVEYAEKCLALLKSTIEAGAIWHFTDIGQFHQEVIRYACNCIAWHRSVQTEDPAKLQELLDLITMGAQYVDSPAYYYVLDTKVRILLKLNRKEEAYTIVYSCLKKDRNFTDFQDIARLDDYQQWKSNLEAGILVELTSQEREILDKAERIATKLKQWIIDDEAKKPIFSEAIAPKEVILIRQAKDKYKISSYRDLDDSILLINGDVHVKGPINDAWLNKQLEGMKWKGNLYGVLIAGNLTVDGDVIDDEYLELYVTGNLTCDYLFTCNGIIEVKSDATIRYGIYGEYNDGSLSIHGKLNTPFLIAYDHSMPQSAECEFIFIEGGNGTDRESIAIREGVGGRWSDQHFDEPQKLLSPDVWNDQDEFSVDFFFDKLRKGISPFAKAK